MSPKLVPLPSAPVEGLKGLLFELEPEQAGPRIKYGMTDEAGADPSTIVTPGLTRSLPASSPSEALLERLAATRASPPCAAGR